MLRWIGAGLGLFSGFGLLGAVAGYFIGAYIDRSRAMGGRPQDGLASAKLRRELYFQTSFRLLGLLAKADGRISEEEISQAEDLMGQLNLSAERRRTAIAYFKQGAQADFDLKTELHEFVAQCGRKTNMSNILLVSLVNMALADGELHTKEQRLLQNIAMELGFNQAYFDNILAMVSAQSGFHYRGQQHSGAYSARTGSADAVTQAYQALGVEPSIDDRSLKRAYRKLISKHHPDKLIAQGVPEDLIAFATEKSQEIQAAYDLLEKHRREP